MCRAMSRTLSVVVMGCVLFVAVSCGGKRPPAVTPGTGPVGLPPLPGDLAAEVYQADAYLGRGCADVPSGLNNCQKWLRESAEARMVDFLDHQITDRIVSEDRPSVEGDHQQGGFGESSAIERHIAREAVLSLSLRTIESPLLALQDGRHYAMRVLVVRADADYNILNAMAEKAERAGRSDLAGRYRTQARERFGDAGPGASKTRDIERRVADYYRQLWEMTQNTKENKP